MIDKADSSGGIEEENALLKRLEDLLEEAFFANQPRKERLNFLWLDLVEP